MRLANNINILYTECIKKVDSFEIFDKYRLFEYSYNVEQTNIFRKDKFSRAGSGLFFSSIKNSLRAKFRGLKRILSS